jgi:Fe2+ or Zn2+ uptake regulation protein
MVAMSELERGANDRLAEHDLRYTDLAQSSAYRNLGLLEEAGVVRRLVHDVTLETKLERTLDTAFDTLAGAEGFVTTHHTVDRELSARAASMI